LDFAASSDPLIAAALLTALVSVAIVAALVLQIAVHRVLLALAEVQRAQAEARWRDVLLDWMAGEQPELPRIGLGETGELLKMWCAMQEALRGDAKAGLNALLIRLKLDQRCRRWLRGHSVRRILTSLRVLGHLGAVDDWPRVRRFVNVRRSFLSLVAARALMRIEPVRSVPVILDCYARRADWPPSAALAMLQEAGPDAVTERLLGWIGKLPRNKLARGLQMLPAAYDTQASDLVLRLLRTARETDVLAVCLRVVDEPAALPRIRAMLKHRRWPVRTQAVKALGRLGTKEDRALIEAMLGDSSWWVRLRAAQALLVAPGIEREEIERLAHAHTSDDARQMLLHVLAEGRTG